MIIIAAVIVLHCMFNLCITILHLPILYARRGVEVYCVCVYGLLDLSTCSDLKKKRQTMVIK